MNKNWHRGKYPPTLIEVVATQTLLFNLGYSPKEEIFIIIDEGKVAVALVAEGKQLGFRVGAPELPPAEMLALMQDLMKEWNTGGSFSTEEKDLLLNNSYAFTQKVKLVFSLVAHGFTRMPIDRRQQRGMH